MYRGNTISVVLPTYNEKDSIRGVIDRFAELGVVDDILVINNNAAEGTSEEVAGSSAREIVETEQGYGAAILRGLREATGNLIVICEPDGTFDECDLYKLLEYSRDFEVVFGSRTMNGMIWDGANMGWFLRTGNWAVAKLMEVLFNTSSLSDVGCTYRLMTRSVADHVLNVCKVKGSFFGPEMMIEVFVAGFRALQLPLNYKKRIGTSSVTGSQWVAFCLGMRMIRLILEKRFIYWMHPPTKLSTRPLQ